MARQLLRRLDGLPLPEQLSVLNHAFMFGYQRLPRLYDALVGLVFPLGATDLTKPVPDGAGNVLVSRPEGNETAGHHSSSVVGLARNAWTVLHDRIPK